MKIVAVIPAYNEENTIADIVKRASQYVNCGVIVVDDGSSDQTGWVAERAGAEVDKLWRNFGAGAATRTGLGFARARDADVVVTLDGDGQHDAIEIPDVIAPILEGYADLVIGSRFMGDYKMPKYRRFGIGVITWLYNVGSKQKIRDGQSCFRAYGRKALESLEITEGGFAFSVETLIKAHKNGLRIVEVPITCHYHERYWDNSTLNPVRHGLSVALAVIKWRVKLRV